MPVIRTVVNDETYASLSQKQRKAGLLSISALFLSKCNESPKDAEADKIVRRAIKLAACKSPGEEFRLQDLFPADTWEEFSKGARLRSGRLFKAEAKTGQRGIQAVRTSGSNHQFYARLNAPQLD